MKSNIKKAVSVILALVIVLCAAPLSGFTAIFASALDASGILSETVSWTFDEATGTLTISGIGNMPDYDSSGDSPFFNNSSIKKVVVENGITSIGEHSFTNCTGLTSVSLPESVTYINYSAFSGCRSLMNVDFPDSLTYIGSSAFAYCTGLTSIDFPDSLTHLGSSAFAGCTGLTDITIPGGITELYENTFAYCTSLTGITIPENITGIDIAFPGCTGITDIKVDKNNSVFDSRNNCNAIIETETNKLILGCKNTLIPDSVTCIDEGAFYGCAGLHSITIESSVKSIRESAFSGCTALKKVYYMGTEENWADISIDADNDELLNAEIIFKNGTVRLGSLFYSYDERNGELIISGEGAMPDFASAEESPFAGKAFGDVIVEEGVTSIGEHAFENSHILRLTIYDSMSSINDYAFNDCNPDMEIYYYCTAENEVINIGPDNDFKNENIHCFISYSVSEDISAILDLYNGDLYIDGNGDIPDYSSAEESPFAEDIEYIKNIVISTNVSGIGSYAFANANADYLIVYNTVENINANAFSGAKINTVCFYDDTDNDSDTANINPVGNECIKNAPYTQYYEFSNSTETAVIKGTGAMPDCGREYMPPLDLGGMKKIVIDVGITRIGAYAFDYCDPETIEISDTVTSIGLFSLSFSSESVKSVIIGNSVTIIEEGAFWGLKNLTSIKLPASLTYIGNDAFAYSGLESIEIPAGVKNIGEGAFAGIDNLEKVIIKSSYVKFGDNVFMDSPALREVLITSGGVEYTEDCYNSFNTLNNGALVVCAGNKFADDLKAAGVNCVEYVVEIINDIPVIHFSGTITVDEDSDYQFMQYILEKYPDTEYVYFENLVLYGVDTASVDRSLREHVTVQNGNLYLKNVYVNAHVDGRNLSFSDFRTAAENGTLASLVVTKLTDGETIIEIVLILFTSIKSNLAGILRQAANFVNKVIGIFRR